MMINDLLSSQVFVYFFLVSRKKEKQQRKIKKKEFKQNDYIVLRSLLISYFFFFSKILSHKYSRLSEWRFPKAIFLFLFFLIRFLFVFQIINLCALYFLLSWYFIIKENFNLDGVSTRKEEKKTLHFHFRARSKYLESEINRNTVKLNKTM